MGEIRLDVLARKIIGLRQELEDKLGGNLNQLSSPEVLEINNKIDKLLVSYLRLTI